MIKTDKKTISIKNYIVIVMLILIVVGILAWMVNGSFMENYFQNKKVTAMKGAYEKINIASNNDAFDTDEFDEAFRKIIETEGVNVLVMDTASETLKASSLEYKKLERDLLGYFFNGVNNLYNPDDTKSFKDYKVLEENNKYSICLITSSRNAIDYIDMWGILDNGNPFIIRSSMESVRESATIAGKFFTYVLIGIAVFMLSSIVIYGRHETIVKLRNENDRLIEDIARRNELDNMRSEFLNSVSHELKTPIAIIQGYAEGLIDVVNQDEESKNYYCDVIVDEAAKMNDMVRKLIDINHLEFGDTNFEIEDFDIVALIKDYLKSTSVLIENAGTHVKFDETDPIIVQSDEYYIREVFGNYFTNALHYADGDKDIDIRIEMRDNKAYVSVFNTGSSIPEESIEHLYEKFYKVDKARTREYGGSGVGLSIVKAILDSLNEDYGVKNYSNGVEFYFSIKLGGSTNEEA